MTGFLSPSAGAYLILYLGFVYLVGLPLYLLEASMGQFSSCGPLHVFACFPLGRGLGLSMCLLAALRLLDAALVLAQGTLYWGASFTTRMPWMLCDVAWGAQPHSCYVRSTGIRLCGPLLTALLGGDVERVHGQGEVSQTSAVPMELANGSMRQIHYDDYLEHLHGCVTANQSSAEQYYQYRVLNKGPEVISRDLLGYYGAVWILIFLASVNIRTYTTVLRLVAPSPLVVLGMFFFFGVNKRGALKGITSMLSVDMNSFYDVRIWHSAASDVLSSLGIATGAIFVFASFNPINTPIKSVVQKVVLMDVATSLLSSLLMFTELGILSAETQRPLGDYVTDGGSTRMFFMLISEYVGDAAYPQYASSLLAVTLLQLGLNQAVAGTWTLVTCVTDEFPSLRPMTGSLIAVVCVLGFAASVPYVMPQGFVIALLINRFAVQIPELLVACLETVAFVWGYGVDRLLFDMVFMEQGHPEPYWVRCWSWLTPCLLLTVLGATLTTLQEFIREIEMLDVQARLACLFVLFGSLAGVPLLVMTWLFENNLDVELSQLPCAHWGPREAIYFRAYHEAIKHSDLPAQKKVHRTDRKETVAEKFTLYLVRHSPKYMGRFIRAAAQATPPSARLFARVREPFPCE
ncbi:sodium-dependent proline transporter-like [Haemaphysalis longicornis]